MDLVQTNIKLTPAQRQLLDDTAETNGWSLHETALRGIRLVSTLTAAYNRWADTLDDDKSALLRRIINELGLELLVDRKLEWRENDEGRLGLLLDDGGVLTTGPVSDDFPNGPLIITRQIGTAVEVQAVYNGTLVPVGTYPLADPALN
jgi:hypothetical protein